MSKIIDRSGSGAALTAAENDANLSSLSGINEVQAGTTHTIDIDDQNKTIEYSNASAVTVTLTLLSTITGATHTDDYRVILVSQGAGGITVNVNAADTFNDTSTSITLNQYEAVEIQSSNTATIWNVLRKHVDAATITGTETLTNKTLTSPVINTPTITSPVINTAVSGSAFIDDDTMASATSTIFSSSESIKAYVDNLISAIDDYPAFRAYRSSNEAITLPAPIIFNAENFDTASDYSGSTGRFTPSTAGIYLVVGQYNVLTPGSSGVETSIFLYKNSTIYAEGSQWTTVSTDDTRPKVIALVEMNGTTDTVEIRTDASFTVQGDAGGINTYFQAHRVRALP